MLEVFYRSTRKQAVPQDGATVFLQGDVFWLWPTGSGYACGQFSISQQSATDGTFRGKYTAFSGQGGSPPADIRGTISGNRITFDGLPPNPTLHFDGMLTTNVGDDAEDTVQGTLKNGGTSVPVWGHDGFIW
jgi:hypothetical protein